MCSRASMYYRATHVCLIPVPACINLFLVWIGLSGPAPSSGSNERRLIPLTEPGAVREVLFPPLPRPKQFFFLPLYLSGLFFHPHTYPVHLATHLHPHPSYISTPSIFKGLSSFFAMAAKLATKRKNYWKMLSLLKLRSMRCIKVGVHVKGL
jgi:hypothetical protein